MSALEKARIFAPSAPKAGFSVQFNPNTLSYSAGLSRQAYKGTADQEGQGSPGDQDLQRSPLSDWQGAALSVKLFYHTYSGPTNFTDVRTDINRIRAFLPPLSENTEVSSPKITFAWGTITHTGTLEAFSVSYQMFAHDGTPVQAEVSITIRGEDPDVRSAAANRALGGGREPDSASPAADFSWLFQS